VSFKSEDKLPQVLKTLAKNNISSAPVKSGNSWIGLIDMLDLVSTLSSIIEAKLEAMNATTMGTPAGPCLDWDELELVKSQEIGELCDISEQNPWVSISENETLTQILRLMSKKTNIHRLPVLYDDIQSPSSNSGDYDDVIVLLSQSAVLQYILNNIGKVPENIRNSRVQDWFHPKTTNFKSNVESVSVIEPTYKAFRKIAQKELTGVAIVNATGELCGCLSASDLKRSKEESFLNDLYLPVGKYISLKRADLFHKAITCTWDDSLQTVAEKLVQNKVHRVFVVEEQDEGEAVKPVGVISLCDALTVFLGDQ